MGTKNRPPEKHHSHLTFEDRVRIDEMLRRSDSMRSIAAALGKTPSTISREIKKHTQVIPTRKNDCLHRRECTKKKVCGKAGCTAKKCKSCSVPCKRHCSDYVQAFCEKLSEPSVVCNGCKSSHICMYEQRRYDPKLAQKEYRSMLKDRRNGFDLTCEQLISIDEQVSPLINRGLSPFHIKQALGEDLPVSESTLRRLIRSCELDARNIDLRAAVSRKPRNRNSSGQKKETLSIPKLGHMYRDYLAFMDSNDVTAVQMDCVEGIKEDRAVLLTLHFPVFHMQLAFIMSEHTSACVVQTLDKLEETLGPELFRQAFPVILTDNGHEFTDIPGMERSVYGGQRTRIFFCEPNRSDEKGACENNHRLIRYVIPKGTSLEPFWQADITLMMNHINSYSRKALYGHTPYGLAMNVLPEDFFILLGLEQIPPAELELKPSLLQR